MTTMEESRHPLQHLIEAIVLQADLLRYLFPAGIFVNQYALRFIVPSTNIQVVEEDGIDPDNMTYEVRFMKSFVFVLVFHQCCVPASFWF